MDMILISAQGGVKPGMGISFYRENPLYSDIFWENGIYASQVVHGRWSMVHGSFFFVNIHGPWTMDYGLSFRIKMSKKLLCMYARIRASATCGFYGFP